MLPITGDPSVSPETGGLKCCRKLGVDVAFEFSYPGGLESGDGIMVLLVW